MADVKYDADGVIEDEVPSPKRGWAARTRREKTPEELAHAEEQRAYKATVRTALEALCPALMAEGEPPLHEGGGPGLQRLVATADVHPLLELPRVTGSGAPGSKLLLSSRHHDAVGEYVLLAVSFFAGGYKYRTRGCAVRRDEIRAVARALLEYADAAGLPPEGEP